MRSLLRNKQTLYYSLYEGKQEIVDEHGLPTGDYEEMYGELVPFKANVSANRGSTSYNFYGIDTNYSHIVTTTNKDLPIDEETLIYYKDNPYFVVKKSISLNGVVLAISEV